MNAIRNPNRQFIRGIGIVDETSCGPLCQHPACWKSNERVEKGLPNLTDKSVSRYNEEDELPAVKVYNVLEDYGFSSRDRFPSVENKKSLHCSESLQLASCPMNTPSPSRFHRVKSIEPKQEAKGTCVPVKQVEVQEVFDLEDLSSTWENTFQAKQYYVWVPNPNWKKTKPIEETKEMTNPCPVPPRDLTEELVPQSIERDREAAITKRNTQRRSWSPFRFFSPSFWQTTRDDVDIEGINELLDLPRDVLMKVLDYCHPSDLKSREKLHEIILRFMPHHEYINAEMDHSQDDVLRQTKIQLHEAKSRNQRQQPLMASGQPVFRFDDNRCICSANVDLKPMIASFTPSSVGITPMNSAAEITRSHSPRTKLLSKYKKPLPGIGERGSSLDNIKVASVSLGLPELPSGVRTTRAFNYTNLNMDFTLGPSIPIASESVALSEGGGSDHGTTMNVNLPSQLSEKLDIQTLPDRRTESQHSRQESFPQTGPELIQGHRYVCPDPPLGTPMSAPGMARSYTKSNGLIRDITMDSVKEVPQDKPSSGRSKERNVHVSSPAILQRELSQTPSSNTAVMGKVSESATSEPSDIRKVASSRRTIVFQKEVPPQPPSSPQSGHGEMSSMSPIPSVTHVITTAQGVKELNVVTPMATQGESQAQSDLMTHGTPQTGDRTESPVSSTEPWPIDIVEKNFEMSRTTTRQSTYIPMTPETLDSTAVGFDSRSEKSHLTSVPQSEIDSQISEKSAAKQILDEKSSRESPGPPPPSPEPKKRGTMPMNPDRFSSKSRDSLSMAPVFEEVESEEESSISADPPNPLIDSQHFPEVILDPNVDQLHQNGTAFVALDKIEDTPESKLESGRSELKLISDELEQSLEEQMDYSDRHRTESLKDLQLDLFTSCPPETDGRSSTYLTERDRRFSPDGMESQSDNDDRRSTHQSHADSPWQPEDDFNADNSETQGQNTVQDGDGNENKNNASDEKVLTPFINKYDNDKANEIITADDVSLNTPMEEDVLVGKDVFGEKSADNNIQDDRKAQNETELYSHNPDEESQFISIPENPDQDNIQAANDLQRVESLDQKCERSKEQSHLDSSTVRRDIPEDPCAQKSQSQAFLMSENCEERIPQEERSVGTDEIVEGDNTEMTDADGHQSQNRSASMDLENHSETLEGSRKDSSADSIPQTNEGNNDRNTEGSVDAGVEVNKEVDRIDADCVTPSSYVHEDTDDPNCVNLDGGRPSYIN